MLIDFRATEAGVTLLNEIGLDPGIDHLLAMECIHEVQNAGGRIESFISYCGGMYGCNYISGPQPFIKY